MQTTTTLVLALAALVPATLAQVVPPTYTVTSLTPTSSATAMAVAPNGDVYFCQQAGLLRVWQAPATVTTVAAFTVDSFFERGLIGVALDPNFATNRFVYIHYTATTPTIHNRVSRIELNAAGTMMVAGTETVLLDLETVSAGNHNGGAIHFGPDGMLYVGVGENAVPSNAQAITNLKGKILRIGTTPGNVIPNDNPMSFPGIMGSPTGTNRAIWAVGLRNPFTFAFQPGTGRMFINDVGQNAWEEINDGIAGRNYGWSMTEGRFTQASFPNFTNPLVAYSHSNGTLNFPAGIGNFTGFAIAGGVFYTPGPGVKPNFPISYQNDYFFGEYVSDLIRTFDPAANNGAGFATAVGGVVDLALAPDSTLLYLRQSALGRITFNANNGACCTPGGSCNLTNGLTCASGNSFVWGGVCAPNPCPQPMGACCAVDGSCGVSTQAACTGTYQGDGTTCATSPCPPPMGACCLANGTCESTTEAGCTGTYQGNGTSCAVIPCPQPNGACCRGSICEVTTLGACPGPNTTFVGNSACNAPGNFTTPCCKADFNQSGVISVQDIFDFLEAYFSGDPTTDINDSGVISVQDIFDFLEAYFNGCP